MNSPVQWKENTVKRQFIWSIYLPSSEKLQKITWHPINVPVLWTEGHYGPVPPLVLLLPLTEKSPHLPPVFAFGQEENILREKDHTKDKTLCLHQEKLRWPCHALP